MSHICIVDYGVGNMHSAMKGLKRFSDDVLLTEDFVEIQQAAALVLPGQGSFAAGMEGLKVRGLLDEVKRAADKGKPILGICLGAQILLDRGHEFGEWDGLGIIPGDVVHFPPLSEGTKIPHMGWNGIEPTNPGAWEGTALEGIEPNAPMYFIHSYLLQPSDPSVILATTTYGGHRFASVVSRGNVLACQFHPEKSASCGLRIIENFVRGIERT